MTLSGSDLDNDALTYSATNLPSGATFSSATGEFIWTPGNDQVGSYDLNFKANDGEADSDSVSVAISVIKKVSQENGSAGGAGGGGLPGQPFGEFTFAPVNVPAVNQPAPAVQNEVSQPNANEPAPQSQISQPVSNPANLIAEAVSQVPVLADQPVQNENEITEPQSLVANIVEFIKAKEVINFVSNSVTGIFSFLKNLIF